MFSSLAALAEIRASSAGPKASQRIEAATSGRFEELSRLDAAQVLEGLGSSESGLTAQAFTNRLLVISALQSVWPSE